MMYIPIVYYNTSKKLLKKIKMKRKINIYLFIINELQFQNKINKNSKSFMYLAYKIAFHYSFLSCFIRYYEIKQKKYFNSVVYYELMSVMLHPDNFHHFQDWKLTTSIDKME